MTRVYFIVHDTVWYSMMRDLLAVTTGFTPYEYPVYHEPIMVVWSKTPTQLEEDTDTERID